MSDPNALDETFWNSRYETNATGWDIGFVSTPLKAYFDQLTDKSVSILIPGCGNAHEAVYLLEQGFTNITLVDISSRAIALVKEKLKRYDEENLTIIHGDFFELKEQYDIIVEQTFFCAIDPQLREAYAAKMQGLLKEGGKLVGLLFNRSFEGGPPFGGNREEYFTIFSQYFTIKTMEPAHNSIFPRKETELFLIGMKRGNKAQVLQ